MKAIFLDRDGTIIVDPPDEVVNSFEKIQLFPHTIDALKLLATLDYGVILISSQIGIAKGMLTEEDFEKINNRVLELIAPSGINILKTYHCPHAPEDNCNCRKPKPGMLLQAKQDFDIDMENSFMIGDRESDILVGLNAGTKTIALQTGLKPVDASKATFNAKNILEAIQFISENY